MRTGLTLLEKGDRVKEDRRDVYGWENPDRDGTSTEVVDGVGAEVEGGRRFSRWVVDRVGEETVEVPKLKSKCA